MPELPEVEALAAYLRERAVGQTVDRIEVAAISALKTYDPPVSAVAGLPVTGATRHGKFLDITLGSASPGDPAALSAAKLHLVVHLARAGWLHYRDSLSPAPLKPSGKGPIALRVRLSDGSGFDLTEAGTQKKLAAYLVRQPSEVPAVARAVLTDAVQRSVGQKAATLKGEKRSGLAVHARTGLPCPVCGDTIREVSFHDSSLQYCPGCQTGGKPLADRRLSRLVR